MTIKSKELKDAGWVLFRFAEILEKYAELPDKKYNDRFFALEWASKCHHMSRELNEWHDAGVIDNIIEDVEKFEKKVIEK